MNLIASLSTATNWPKARDWSNYPGQQSVAIPLAKASAYYIEARMKSGPGTNDVASGNDANSTNIAHHISVAWQCDATNLPPTVIPGSSLAPSTPNYNPLPVAPIGLLHADGIPGIQVTKVSVSDLNPQDHHTFSITAGDEEGVFLMEPTTGEVLLASDIALTASGRTNFDLTVQVTDNGTPPRSGTTTVAIEVVPAGFIAASVLSAEIWTNIAGSSIADLTSRAKFPRFPDLVIGYDAFDSPRIYPSASESPLFWAGLPAASGTRMRACLTPTNSGLYTLFVASRDESRLLFSFSTNSAEATIRAYVTTEGTEPYDWTHNVSQQTTVWLDAGNRYYIEAIAKADGPLAGCFSARQSSWDAVIWKSAGPGQVWREPTSLEPLSSRPLDIENAPLLTNQSFILPITTSNNAVVTTLTAQDSPADRLAYRIISGNVSNTFRLNPVSGELVVTDNSGFTSYAVSNFNLGVQVQDSGYGGRYPLHSAFANVSVSVVDNSSPALWTGNGSDRNWSTSRNWDGDGPSGRKQAHLRWTESAHQLQRPLDLCRPRYSSRQWLPYRRESHRASRRDKQLREQYLGH
jgi:hypothetical protein